MKRLPVCVVLAVIGLLGIGGMRAQGTRLLRQPTDLPPFVVPLPMLDQTPRPAAETEQNQTNWRMPGSLHVPLSNLEERMAELPQDRHLVVYCLGGYRSTIACSMLKARGYEHLTDLAGGIRAWTGPTESD